MTVYEGINYKQGLFKERTEINYPETFIAAWKKTMQWEGGGNAHRIKGDTGGWTKWGISQKAYPSLDIKNLTREQAKKLAYRDYWLLMNCSIISSLCPKTAAHVFDIGFNMGHRWGIKMLQRAINKVAGQKVLKDDGIFGRLTLAALYGTDKQLLAKALQQVRVKRFKWLAYRYPKNHKFLKGWLNRANDFA